MRDERGFALQLANFDQVSIRSSLTVEDVLAGASTKKRQRRAMTGAAAALIVVGAGVGISQLATPSSRSISPGSAPVESTSATVSPDTTPVQSSTPDGTDPVSVTGLRRGDPVPTVGRQPGFDENGNYDPALVPLWVAVTDDSLTVIGYVHGHDDGPSTSDVLLVEIFNEQGEVIGHFINGSPMIGR